MKKLLLTFAAILLPLMLSAQTIELNGIYYELSEDGSPHATVAGTNRSISGDIVISDVVEYDGKKYDVTYIRCYAFNFCTNLMSITIPSSVIPEGEGWFENCPNLSDVKVVVKDYAEFCSNQILRSFNNPFSYYDYDSNEWISKDFTIHLIDTDGNEITEYIIPDGVTSIWGAAFKGCTSLTSITIPNSVTSIGDQAFFDCSGLKLVISEITTPFEVNAFGWSDTSEHSVSDWWIGLPPSWYLPTLVVPKGSRTAYKNMNVWKYFFTFEEGETIYEREQTDEQGICYQLREADDNSICYAVTGYTDALKSEIVIPADLGGCPVKTIESLYGDGAFQNCTNLPSITIPNSVTSISREAFYGCINLKDVNIVVSDYSEFCNNKFIVSLETPFSYWDYDRNENITIDYTIHLIDTDGNEITEYIIPDGVTSIGVAAFKGCRGLTSITIPNSVTSIGNQAFYGCSGLSLVTSEISTPFDVDAFSSFDATLVVPKGSRADYKSVSGWEFASIYEEGETIYARMLTDEQGIVYQLRKADDNSIYYAVIGHTDDLKSEIFIPADIDGCPVRVIDTFEPGGAFAYCNDLTSVKILGNQLTRIGYRSFYGCTNLSSLTISNSMTGIDGEALWGCINLKDVNIVVTDYSEFCNNTILREFNTPLSYWDYEKGEDITIYYAIHLIDTDGNEITEYIIPDGVISIGESAFKGCTGLTSITIPNSVETIGDGAFWNCSGLKLVKSEISTPFDVNAFGVSDDPNDPDHRFGTWLDDAILVVPKGSRTAYRSVSGWREFAFTYEEGETIYDRGQTDDQGLYYALRQADDYSFYYEVTGYSDKLNTEIIIPADLGGIPVRSVYKSCFRDRQTLTKITIPGSVTLVDAEIDYSDPGYTDPWNTNNIFLYGCINLKDVNVVVMDYSEFCNNTILREFNTPLSYWDYERNEDITIDYAIHLIDTDGNEITEYIIPDGVTSIGGSAFKGCTGLTSITIPNSVTSIGDQAFWDCTGLKLVASEISTPFDVNAFGVSNPPLDYEWSSDAILVVPKGSRTAYRSVSGWNVALMFEEGETIYDRMLTDEQGIVYQLKEADDYSLYYAVTGHSDDLKSEIVIPADIDGCPVKTIETPMAVGAFDGCSNLTSVKILGNQMTTIEFGAFKGCANLTTVKMANSIRSIGDYAFFECTSLTSITLPKDLESIGYCAFSSEMWDNYCPITSIHIPHNVKTIGNDAFRNCHDLALVSFDVDVDGNSALTSIGSAAFMGCSFSSITIPNSVITIGSETFGYNNNLTIAILSDGITEIASWTFHNCENLASITIPEGVTRIGEYAFNGCWSLTSVKLPESLTSMGEYAFSGCQLKSIELPNSFTEIPANLFSENDLEYIKLGNNVKSIGKNAFGSWLDTAMDESLVVIEIGTSTPPTIAKDAFPRLEALSVINVIVPDAAAETAYRKAAVWKEMTFSNQDNISEVTVDTPGDLDYELITECDMQPAKVVNLKVKGAINAKDFDQMRTNMKSLLRLDLSECDITEIPDGALQDKTQLQELTLPTKLQTIGNYAFEGCPYLTGKLNLPSGVTSIGEHAFEGTYYTSVALPFKLQTIGSYAFYNLPIKQKINLPDALTSIGDYAFAETQISGHAELPEGIRYLGDGAFRNTQIDYVSPPDNPKGITSISRELFQGCTNLDYIYIPRNFTEISGYAFDGCTNLSYVRLSPNLETLGEYAFQNTELEYIKIPSKVKNLSEGVFRNCKNLESLSLPADLKEVGRDALRGCNALRNLSVEAIEPPTVDKSALIGINTDLCLISIPTTSYRQYVTAEYWGQFVQMRNDIAVETEGDGEIGFESVVEEEDEVLASRKRAQRSAAARGMTRASEEEDDPKMTLANNGSSVYVPKNGLVRFIIIPGDGEELLSATLDGEDIMPAIVDGVYTATADKKNAKLVVKFSGTAKAQVGDANGDNDVNASDVVAITDYMMGNEPEKFSTRAADMNNDTFFNIADIIQIVNQILSKE